jgi:hypothetical protein
MASEAETAFVKTLLNTLSTQPVTYAEDYQQPPENFLKKIPVLPVRTHHQQHHLHLRPVTGSQIQLPPPPHKNDAPTLAGEPRCSDQC